MKLTSITKAGNKGAITVPKDLFAAPVNKIILSQAVRVYLSNLRQGTSKAQTRSEVTRTKAKWYAQKGTGRARHGARSAPIFVGGGVAHGPKGVENWQKKMSTKMKHKALISALSAQAEQTYVINHLEDLEGKTKEAAAILEPILADDLRLLVILPERIEPVERSLRNLPQVLIKTADQVNALDVAAANKIVVTKSAVAELEARLLNQDKN